MQIKHWSCAVTLIAVFFMSAVLISVLLAIEELFSTALLHIMNLMAQVLLLYILKVAIHFLVIDYCNDCHDQ